MFETPVFPGNLKKNDAIFLYGAVSAKPFVFAYDQESTEIVHGPACKPEQEIFIDLCNRESIPIVQRRGGGGTVVLMPGMLITIIVGKRMRDQDPLNIFGRIHDSMISLLMSRGIKNIEKKGISDLAVNNRKIMGSSLYLGSNPSLYYYQSSLMVDCDKSVISRYLGDPPKKPDYREGRSHEQFCTTLFNEGIGIKLSTIKDLFNKCLTGLLI